MPEVAYEQVRVNCAKVFEMTGVKVGFVPAKHVDAPDM